MNNQPPHPGDMSAEEHEDRYRARKAAARLAEMEEQSVHAHLKWDYWMTRARDAEARLVAVIALCDRNCDDWTPGVDDFRAAATGDTQ